MEGIKNLKEVIDFLKAAEICSSCKSKNVYPVITPNLYLLRISSEYSNPGDIVFDPMCGSGTTCKMAKLTGRNYIGIDISEEYCQIAEERIESV